MKFKIEPPKDWQHPIFVTINIDELKIRSRILTTDEQYENMKAKGENGYKCDYCPETDTNAYRPEIKVLEIYDSNSTGIDWKERLQKKIEKVYKDRYACDSTECIRKFNNDTARKLILKGHIA